MKEKKCKSNIESNFIDYNSKIINKIKIKNKETEMDNLNLNEKKIDEKLERINDEMFFKKEDLDINIVNRKISMNNYDNNNFMIRHISKEKSDKGIFQNNSFDKIYKLLNDNISNTNSEKLLLDNHSFNSDKGNKKINIYNNIVINNPQKNENIINANNIKKNRFDILENSSADSFSINSTYENINKISKYKYASNESLQLKIKKILFQSNNFSDFKTIKKTKTYFKEENPIRKNINYKDKNLYYHSIGKNKFDDEKSPTNSHLVKHKIINLMHNSDDDTPKISKESNINFDNNNNEDINFYTKIKMKTRKSFKNFDRIKKLNNFEDKISKNIEKNKQNLNNPSEYFSVLFNKILYKKKNT